MSDYSYTLDFTSYSEIDLLNFCDRLDKEISASLININYNCVFATVNNLKITYFVELSINDKIILDDIVDKWYNNQLLNDTSPSAEIYYFHSSGVNISLDPSNTWYPINPACTLITNTPYYNQTIFEIPMSNTGSLKWLKNIHQYFICNVNIIGYVNRTNNVYLIALFKNDVIIPGTTRRFEFLINGITANITINTRILLAENDIIDVRIQAVDPSTPRVFTIRNLNINLHL